MIPKRNFIERLKLRSKYATNQRAPFYDLAAQYLPQKKESAVVDIGSGYGFFAEYLNLYSLYENLFLLDADSGAVKKLRNRYFIKLQMFYLLQIILLILFTAVI